MLVFEVKSQKLANFSQFWPFSLLSSHLVAVKNVAKKGNGGDRQADQDRHCQCGQVQAKTVQAGVQEILSGGADGQVVHRSHA